MEKIYLDLWAVIRQFCGRAWIVCWECHLEIDYIMLHKCCDLFWLRIINLGCRTSLFILFDFSPNFLFNFDWIYFLYANWKAGEQEKIFFNKTVFCSNCARRHRTPKNSLIRTNQLEPHTPSIFYRFAVTEPEAFEIFDWKQHQQWQPILSTLWKLRWQWVSQWNLQLFVSILKLAFRLSRNR